MRFYYYTKWKFKGIPEGLDGVGPYHSTWETDSPAKEFVSDAWFANLSEFFFKQFDSKEEMKAYWNQVS